MKWIKIAASPMSREFVNYMKSLGWEQYPGKPSLMTRKFKDKSGKEFLFAYNLYRYKMSYGEEPLYTIEGGFYNLENEKPTGYEMRGSKTEEGFDDHSLYRSEDFKDLESMKSAINDFVGKIKYNFTEI